MATAEQFRFEFRRNSQSPWERGEILTDDVAEQQRGINQANGYLGWTKYRIVAVATKQPDTG